MATDRRKVLLGAVLLFASSALIFGTGTVSIGMPALGATAAAFGLAAGALLVGTAGDGRPV